MQFNVSVNVCIREDLAISNPNGVLHFYDQIDVLIILQILSTAARTIVVMRMLLVSIRMDHIYAVVMKVLLVMDSHALVILL